MSHKRFHAACTYYHLGHYCLGWMFNNIRTKHYWMSQLNSLCMSHKGFHSAWLKQPVWFIDRFAKLALEAMAAIGSWRKYQFVWKCYKYLIFLFYNLWDCERQERKKYFASFGVKKLCVGDDTFGGGEVISIYTGRPQDSYPASCHKYIVKRGIWVRNQGYVTV